MPMVLRSRRSMHPGQASEEPPPDSPRRSTRLPRRATYEDSDESDTESVQSGAVMEIHRGAPAGLEEEEAAEEDVDETELKHCRVVLDRLHAEEKLGKKELEEKEDMNRKGGKATSRIPTFHKRPLAHGAELQIPRKEPSVLQAQSNDKAGRLNVEASNSKTPEVRETALPQLSIRVPKNTSADPLVSSIPEPSAAIRGSLLAALRSGNMSESLLPPLMTASPRPALIRDRVSEGEAIPKIPSSHEGSFSQKIFEKAPPKNEAALDCSFNSNTSGDSNKSPSVLITQEEEEEEEEEDEVEAIIYEEPPWEKESMKAELRDSKSSSEAECEKDLAEEKLEAKLPRREVGEELQEPLMNKFAKSRKESVNTDKSFSSITPEKHHSDQRSRYSSFAHLFLPTALLLLGALGLHAWRFGVPMSVCQLTDQLELHWLEGFGLISRPCSTECQVHLVETIPVGLYDSSPLARPSIADSWLSLLQQANSSVDITAFYFTLQDSDADRSGSSDFQGRKVFEQLKELQSRGVKLQIVVNSPQKSIQDTGELAAAGAEVREVDLQAVTGGIVHTKLWVVDQKDLYLGSANMDWRSLSQVKEVGLSVKGCSCLAQDAFRIFGVYWNLGGVSHTSLPVYWPARLSALSNSQKPLHLKFNGVPARVYLTSAPPQISTSGRADDLSSILSIIDDAQEFIYISVMDYLPMSEYTQPLRLWPAIDLALRSAACTKKVQVSLMVSCWEHSPGSMFAFLQSLLVLNRPPLDCNISVKVFTVPSTAEQKKIPYARVNHAKYMVTDRVLYIGTSNWSETYFTQTAGVGIVVNQTGSDVDPGQETLQSQAKDLFLRDWSSSYSRSLTADDLNPCYP